eukprot:INCI12569.1.p1 GENE.INCI12569.1~~INCI12569.1.p1  ORF type:complete len:715 (+),score=125.65 INCI12569.1:389-2533(+)
MSGSGQRAPLKGSEDGGAAVSQAPVERADGSISPELAAALKAEAAHYARVANEERDKVERLVLGVHDTDNPDVGTGHSPFKRSVVVPQSSVSGPSNAMFVRTASGRSIDALNRSPSYRGVQSKAPVDMRQQRRELEQLQQELQKQQDQAQQQQQQQQRRQAQQQLRGERTMRHVRSRVGHVPASQPRASFHNAENPRLQNPRRVGVAGPWARARFNVANPSWVDEDPGARNAVALREEIERCEAHLGDPEEPSGGQRCISFYLRLVNTVQLLYGLVLAGLGITIMATYNTVVEDGAPGENLALVVTLVASGVILLNCTVFGPWFCGWCFTDHHRLGASATYATVCLFVTVGVSLIIWHILSDPHCNEIFFGSQGNITAIVEALDSDDSQCEALSSSSDVIVALEVLDMDATVAVVVLLLGIVLPLTACLAAGAFYGCLFSVRAQRLRYVRELKTQLLALSKVFEQRQRVGIFSDPADLHKPLHGETKSDITFGRRPVPTHKKTKSEESVQLEEVSTSSDTRFQSGSLKVKSGVSGSSVPTVATADVASSGPSSRASLASSSPSTVQRVQKQPTVVEAETELHGPASQGDKAKAAALLMGTQEQNAASAAPVTLTRPVKEIPNISKASGSAEVAVSVGSGDSGGGDDNDDDDDDEDDDDRMCVVCWESPKDTLIQPCNHMCLCYKCATQLDDRGVRISQCPMCRGQVFDIIKVFF